MTRKLAIASVAIPQHAIVRNGWAEQQAFIRTADVLRYGSRSERREVHRELQRSANKGDKEAQALLRFAATLERC